MVVPTEARQFKGPVPCTGHPTVSVQATGYGAILKGEVRPYTGTTRESFP